MTPEKEQGFDARAILKAQEARAQLFARIGAELDRAYAKHGREPWSRHEFYAVLLEEVDELWDAIKANESDDRVLAELVQVAAMCFRYNETGGAHLAGKGAGDDGLRDPAAPCAMFSNGEPRGDCEGDGHYLCRKCNKREAAA